VARWLRGHAPEAVHDAELVVTELVANAFQHADTPHEVRLFPVPDRRAVRVEVDDGSLRPPRLLHPPPGVSGGRGLMLVAAVCERWGFTPQNWGKTVWAELLVTA
jgi:anti-sigma regulatory factor (Ser/Thr protein kinase)